MRRALVQQLADALSVAVAEHGAPNSFAPAELRAYYGGPAPMLAGRTAGFHLFAINQLTALASEPFRVEYRHPLGMNPRRNPKRFYCYPLDGAQ